MNASRLNLESIGRCIREVDDVMGDVFLRYMYEGKIAKNEAVGGMDIGRVSSYMKSSVESSMRSVEWLQYNRDESLSKVNQFYVI